MSSGYSPFLISEFKTGINTYLQPWIRPIDAFEPLINAYVNRGTVNKRSGYSQFGNRLGDENPVMGIMRYIDESTGSISLLVASTQNLYLYNAGTNEFDDLMISPNFTGNITNFFNYTNWQPQTGSPSNIYMTNNVDEILTYDGTSTAYLTLDLDSSMSPQTLDTCLDVKVYKQRMLYIRPTFSTDGVQNQTIVWSAVNDPTNTILDVAGNGGFLAAPTGDIIQSCEFLRDQLVVFFTNSTWLFRYTGNETNPFRWDKINNSKNNNCPYGSVAYDERVTSEGSTGFIACDGVNVQRYDINIIDYYQNEINEKYYNQVFGTRYDSKNQTWILYVSDQGGYYPDGTSFPIVDSAAPGSDKALIYNFIENSWATYTFNIPLTCMGTFFKPTSNTWGTLNQSWEDTDVAWNAFYGQQNALILLAGDTTGNVWLIDDGDSVVDYWYNSDDELTPISIVPDIVTTRWNPIMQLGQKVQFGYIDIYYYIASRDADNPIQVTLNFYTDNSELIACKRTLTLDGNPQSEYAFKRIYVNLIGEFIQMEIDPNVDSFMQFVGFILWCRPSGRLTP